MWEPLTVGKLDGRKYADLGDSLVVTEVSSEDSLVGLSP